MKRLDRLVIRPSAAILLQLFFFAVQIATASVMGPFMLFWFVGYCGSQCIPDADQVVVVESCAAAQLIFFMILILGQRRLIMVL